MQDQYTEIKEDFKNWRTWINKYKPNTKKAYLQILNTFLPFLIIWILTFFIYDYSYIITLLLSILNGLFLIRIFIIQHDCGHQSFTPSKKKNNFIGFISSLFTFIPFKYWARSHNYHHAHNGQLNFRDIGDITVLTVNEYDSLNFLGKIKYRIYRSSVIMFFLGPLYYIFIHNRLPLIRIKGWEKEKIALFWSNLSLLLFYSFLGYFISYKKLFFIQLPIIITFSSVAIWVFYIQHQHNPNYKKWHPDWDFLLAAIKGSSYYKLSKIGHWFTGNIGYHHIHHLAPRIPFYYLSECHNIYPIFNKYVTSLNFWNSLKCISHNLWDEKNQKMISFKSYYKMKK